MHEHRVGLRAFEHEVQVAVDAQAERAHRLIEHLPMLGRGEHYRLERPVLLERPQHGRHLHRLRPRAERDEHLFLPLHASLLSWPAS